jgi:parallel beta-helix repeat protein
VSIEAAIVKVVISALSAFLLLSICPNVFAETYYVDSSSGKDTWSGRQSAPVTAPSSDGPWQTLARVQAAALAPGDRVLLKCSQTWREPLVISSSGTAASPITIGAYPSGCSTPPAIDGSADIPAYNWTPYIGSIYQARLPIQLVANGSFDAGVAGWRSWSPNNDASIVLASDCLAAGSRCLRFTSGSGPQNGILSSPRFALQAMAYAAQFSLKAPAGIRLRVLVRRDATPWEPLGLDQTIVGAGTWQNYSYSFRGTVDISNARFDIEAPPGITLSLDNIALEASVGVPRQLLADGRQLNLARHPNRGFNATRPLSPYLLLSQDSDQTLVAGKYVSTYLTTGSDLQLPPGASITSGTNVRIRTNAWTIDERTISSVTGNRLSLNSPTSYALKAGWGYLLVGALWMLDEAGEWVYEASGNSVYAWMPDGLVPGTRVAVGYLDVGIDLSNRSYVVIDGLAVRRTGVGVRMTGTSYAVIRNNSVTDTVDEGIDASGSVNGSVEKNALARTGRDAVSGVDRVTWRTATGLRVVGNSIVDSGVRVENGVIVSLPVMSYAAIRAGSASYVAGNLIVNAGYHGIRPFQNGQVANNYIENACTVLDDCGAIYVNGDQNNSSITDNLVFRVPGAIEGKPGNYSQGQGIYLDDLTSGVIASRNTVTDADNGFQLHNAANNFVENNKLYGNRRYQIWLQEDTNRLRAGGDMVGNRIAGNAMVPTNGAPSIRQQTIYSTTAQFGSYDFNRYFNLLSPLVAYETWSQGSQTYTFPQWQAAATATGIPRYLDIHGSQVALGARTQYQVTGTNLVVNGDLANGASGWSSWNQTAPYGVLTLETCSVGPCLKYTVGASPGLVSSPKFSVVKDQRYRVTFDMRVGTQGQTVVVGVRRGGGGTNGYEWLMSPVTITGSTTWKRYTIAFQALKTVTAGDPVTLDNGARIDFDMSVQGQSVWIAKAENFALAPVGVPLRTNILLSPSQLSTLIPCPDANTEPVFCGRYLRFADGMSVSWPYTLGPLGSEIIYAPPDTLNDADGDGIGDPQDSCAGTPAGATVNARGCALGQTPN